MMLLSWVILGSSLVLASGTFDPDFFKKKAEKINGKIDAIQKTIHDLANAKRDLTVNTVDSVSKVGKDIVEQTSKFEGKLAEKFDKDKKKHDGSTSTITYELVQVSPTPPPAGSIVLKPIPPIAPEQPKVEIKPVETTETVKTTQQHITAHCLCDFEKNCCSCPHPNSPTGFVSVQIKSTDLPAVAQTKPTVTVTKPTVDVQQINGQFYLTVPRQGSNVAPGYFLVQNSVPSTNTKLKFGLKKSETPPVVAAVPSQSSTLNVLQGNIPPGYVLAQVPVSSTVGDSQVEANNGQIFVQIPNQGSNLVQVPGNSGYYAVQNQQPQLLNNYPLFNQQGGYYLVQQPSGQPEVLPVGNNNYNRQYYQQRYYPATPNNPGSQESSQPNYPTLPTEPVYGTYQPQPQTNYPPAGFYNPNEQSVPSNNYQQSGPTYSPVGPAQSGPGASGEQTGSYLNQPLQPQQPYVKVNNPSPVGPLTVTASSSPNN